MRKIQNRIYSFDLIRGISIVLVIILHTNPFLNYRKEIKFYALFELCLDISARIAVPLFFLTSGFFLGKKITNKLESSNSIIKYYIYRLFKLYLFWNLVYLVYAVISNFSELAFNQSYTIFTFISKFKLLEILYYGNAFGAHLWFLSALFYSSFLLFFIYNNPWFKYWLVFSFLLHVIGLLGQSYSLLFDLRIDTRDTIFFGMFYTFLGYSFGKGLINPKMDKLKRYHWLIGIILLFSAQLFEGIILVNSFGADEGNYYMFTPFLAVFGFLLFYNLSFDKPRNLFVRLGYNSSGMYFMHLLCIFLVYSFLNITNLKPFRDTFVFHLLFTPFIIFITYHLIQFLDKQFSFREKGIF